MIAAMIVICDSSSPLRGSDLLYSSASSIWNLMWLDPVPDYMSPSAQHPRHYNSYSKYGFSVIHLNLMQVSESEGPEMAGSLKALTFLNDHIYWGISHDGMGEPSHVI